MANDKSSQPTTPFGINDGGMTIMPGEILPVDSSNLWRCERNWSLTNELITDAQSLVYHFSDGSAWCFYNFAGQHETVSHKLAPHENPYRWAWRNNVKYSRVRGASDALVCEYVKGLANQNPPVLLTGWSIDVSVQSPVPAFVQKRDAGSHYLAGEIYLREIGEFTSRDTYVGTLDEAVVALRYIKDFLDIPVHVALKQLTQWEECRQDEIAVEGYDFDYVYTADSLMGSSLVTEATNYCGSLPHICRPGQDENGFTAEDYVKEFKNSHCMTDEEYEEYVDSLG